MTLVSNHRQHHFIFDTSKEAKSRWMLEEVEKEEEGVLRIYHDLSDGLGKILETLDKKLANNELYEQFLKELGKPGIITLSTIHTYLEDIIDELSLDSIILYLDNIDSLSPEENKELNMLLAYRERKLVYILGSGENSREHIYHTSDSHIHIREGDDFITRVLKIIGK